MNAEKELNVAEKKTPVASQSIDKQILAEFLTVCPKTLNKNFEQIGLDACDSNYPWRRVLRSVLRTEGTLLEKHLEKLKRQHPGSVILYGISNLEEELTRPLLTFKEMAHAFGMKSNTLSRAIKEKRIMLPFQTFMIGDNPRLRRYCPLEVELWRDEEIMLELPETSMPKRRQRPELIRPRSRDAEIPPLSVKMAIFGGISRK